MPKIKALLASVGLLQSLTSMFTGSSAPPQTPIPLTPGQPAIGQGSGIGTGNYQVEILLPTIGTLTWNSAQPVIERGFGKGFGAFFQRYLTPILNGAGWSLTLGDGTSVLLAASGTSWTADPRISRSVFNINTSSATETAWDGTSLQYSKIGNTLTWTSTTDRHGQTTQVSNESSALVIRDPYSREETFTYGSQTEGGTALFSEVSDPGGNIYQLTYDPQGHLTQLKMPDGNSYALTYSGDYIIYVQEPDGEATAISYYPSTGIVQSVIESTGETDYAYSQTSVVVTDPYTQYEEDFDSSGRMVALTNNGVTRSYTLGSQNQPLTETGPEGTTNYTYQGLDLASVADPTGTVTSYAYSSTGDIRLITTKLPDGTVHSASYSWSDNHDLLLENYDGFVTSYSRNSAGDVLQIANSSNVIFSGTYDAYGKIVSSCDHYQHCYRRAYDSRGMLASLTLPSGKVRSYQYNALGYLMSLTLPNGKTYSFNYDYLGNQVGPQTVALGGNSLTTTISKSFWPTGALSSISTSTSNQTGATISSSAVQYQSPDQPNLYSSFTQDGVAVMGMASENFQSLNAPAIVPPLAQ